MTLAMEYKTVEIMAEKRGEKIGQKLGRENARYSDVSSGLYSPEKGAELLSIIMGLYPIVSMMQTTVNVTGDATVTAIVARNEKLLNMEKFNS